MTGDSLKTELLVMAVIKHAQAKAMPAVVEKRGDNDRGVIIVRVNRYPYAADKNPEKYPEKYKDGRSRIETRQFNPKSNGPSNGYVWQALRSPSGKTWMGADEADALIARQIQYDPDCWVVTFDDNTNNTKGQNNADSNHNNDDDDENYTNPFAAFFDSSRVP